jgi:hypothetical protein
MAVIGRGFGGAHSGDVAHLAGRIVLPYAPKLIISMLDPALFLNDRLYFNARGGASRPITQLVADVVPQGPKSGHSRLDLLQ